MARKPKVDAGGWARIEIDDHFIDSRERGGEWFFRCPEWPDIPAAWDGSPDCLGAFLAFVSRATQDDEDLTVKVTGG